MLDLCLKSDMFFNQVVNDSDFGILNLKNIILDF